MAIPKPKLPRRTLERIKQQKSGDISRTIDNNKIYFWQRIYGFLPHQVGFLLPFIIEDIKDWFRPEAEEGPAQIAAGVAEEKVGEELFVTGFSAYEKYRCPLGNPLNCQHPQETVEQNPGAIGCAGCGFPAILPKGKEIQGKRGRYRILYYLGSRGLGRMYTAEQIGEGRTVVLKEYLLPKKHFNENEAIAAQTMFESVGSIELADGRAQTGRILTASEAIADRLDRERCYAVTYDTANRYPTLRTHLARTGAMNPPQVRHFLNQALQSLEYLHGQKFRLLNGNIHGGIAHGNLSLDSLLISPEERPFFQDPQFLVYLCDLALWESLFTPPPRAVLNHQASDDLEALGRVSFYLLAGNTQDSSGYPLNPQINRHWGPVDIPLKLFLLRLMGVDTPFASATEARQALLRLPREVEFTREGTAQLPIAVSPKRKRSRLWWLLALFALSALAIAVAGWLSRRQTAIATTGDSSFCCIAQVPGVPVGEFTFTAEQQGLWNYIWLAPNLIQKDKTLQAEFTTRRPQLALNYQPTLTGEEAIARVQAQEADFAISSLTENLRNDLAVQTFAYDGLMVFVAFSSEQSDFSLPHYLKGQITFEQIRRLYTGKITNWQQLGGPDLPVRLYVPTSTEAVRIFEQRILQEEEVISEFRAFLQSQSRSESNRISWFPSSPQIIQLPTLPTLRTVLQDFENEQVGAIGFGPLSQVFGQCSVYPLALGEGKNAPIQPLIQDSGQPINPATDLCNNKGGYFPDVRAFQTGAYPLAYPLAVIYRRDNRRPPIGRGFAEILKTQESQELLGKTGVVTFQGLPRRSGDRNLDTRGSKN